MAQALSVRSATVKFPAGKTFQTQYGERVNAVLVLDDGEEIKLWGSPGDPTLTPLKKGQRVAVAQGDKGWRLLNTPPAEDSPAPQVNGNGKTIRADAQAIATAHTPLTGEEKRAIAAYIDQISDIYRYCVKQTVEKQLTDIDIARDDSEERIRAVATTLFIQTVKKFNL